MDNQQLIESIRTARSNGESKESVFKKLLAEGAKVDQLNDAYEFLESETSKDDAQKRTIRVVVTFAAILIAAGIFSFIAANWQEMSKMTRVLVIITSMIVSYALGYYFREIKNLHKTGNSLLFLGLLIYGSGIFLIGQIFNIQGNWPDGFIFWMIGAITLAFAMEIYPIFYFAILLALIAIGAEPYYIFESFSNRFLQTSTILLFLATVLSFVTAFVIYRKQEKKDFF